MLTSEKTEILNYKEERYLMAELQTLFILTKFFNINNICVYLR